MSNYWSQRKRERLIYERLVANIHNSQYLDTLNRLAFKDWQLYVNASIHLLKELWPFQIRFALFWSSQDILYTYLNAHPHLKDSFVKGMSSLRDPSIPPHHVCVKTPKDKKSPQFVDVLGTIMADRIMKNDNGDNFWHVQVHV